MKTVFVLLAALAASAAADHGFDTEDDVVVLTDDTFDDALDHFDTLLVEFYAPWCGHCKALAPEYAKAATALKEYDLHIAKVDATENRKVADRFEVKGFPTLKFFRGGKATDYTGGRTEDTIVNWITKKSGPAAKTLGSKQEVDDFLEGKDAATVGFFSEESSKTFMTVAGGNDDVSFGVVADGELIDSMGFKDGAIVVFRTFDDGTPAIYEGDASSADDITSFVAASSLPLVIEFSQKMAPRIFGGAINTHFLLFADDGEDGTDAIFAAYKEAATARQGKTLFITVAPEEDRVMGYFDISAADLPTAVLVDMPEGSSMKKFRFPSEGFTADAFTSFVDAFHDGSLKPFLKSEPIPEDGDDFEGGVKVAVGKSFKAIVGNPEHDVLMEFYAPWCGHCKKLAPEYEKAAERFAEVDTVVLAKMDATSNEVDYAGVDVAGFPTLYFFPAGDDKTAVRYEGDRDAEGIEEFLLENAQSDFSLPSEDL